MTVDKDSEILIGSHVSKANLRKAVDSMKITVAQLFIGSPRSWKCSVLSEKDQKFFEEINIPLYIHSSYLVNPASSNPETFSKTIESLNLQLNNAFLAGAEGLVVHSGQAGKDSTVKEAVSRWKKCLSELDLKVPIILENTAGGAAAPGRYVDSFTELWELSKDYDLEYCVDTCHSWAGGFGLENLTERLENSLGKLPVIIHMNGSNDERDSGRDHHQNFDVSKEQTQLSLQFAREVRAPLILEVPYSHFWKDLKLLRELNKK